MYCTNAEMTARLRPVEASPLRMIEPRDSCKNEPPLTKAPPPSPRLWPERATQCESVVPSSVALAWLVMKRQPPNASKRSELRVTLLTLVSLSERLLLSRRQKAPL
jgi:hypothetical protein